MDFRDMMQPLPEPKTPEEKSFREWLAVNRRNFEEGQYTSDEVGILARLVGFDPMLICRELSHFHDAIRGKNFDNKMAQQIYRFEGAVELVQKMKEEMAKKEKEKVRRALGITAMWRHAARQQSGRFWVQHHQGGSK